MISPFWRGVATGALVLGAFIVGALVRLSTSGVAVSLDVSGLAAQVRLEVEEHVQEELPGVLARLQAEVPAQVAQRVAARFQDDRIDLGGLVVQVPPTVARALERQLTLALTEAIRGLLAGVDTGGVAGRVGQEAEALVRARLGRTVAGWRPQVRLLPWWTIPVTVRPD